MRQLCPKLYERVQEGHGIFLRILPDTCASVYAVHNISPVLALTVTGFFSVGFILIFFFME